MILVDHLDRFFEIFFGPGPYGEPDLSCSTRCSARPNVLSSGRLVLGLSGSLLILGAQFWGKRSRDQVTALVGITLKLGLGAGLGFLVVTLITPVGVLRLFTDDPAVIAEAEPYLIVIRYSYVFFCMTQILIASMRCVETVIIIVYVRLMDRKLRLRIHDLLLKRFFRYGFPVILGDVFWGVNLAIQGAIMGRLGPTALASVSIANVVFAIMSVGVYGTTGATSIIIGQTVGSDDHEAIRSYTRTLQVLFIGIGVVSDVAVFFVRGLIGAIYDLEPETLEMTLRFLLVLSVMIVGTSYQVSCLVGIVRSGGATHFVLVNDLIFVWTVVIPSALIAAFVFHASPVIVFACLKSDQILKCAVAVVKVNRYRWIKNLTLDDAGSSTRKPTGTR